MPPDGGTHGVATRCDAYVRGLRRHAQIGQMTTVGQMFEAPWQTVAKDREQGHVLGNTIMLRTRSITEAYVIKILRGRLMIHQPTDREQMGLTSTYVLSAQMMKRFRILRIVSFLM